jgi:hypothetical protein
VEFGSFYLRVSIDCHAPYSSTARRGFVWRVAGEPGMWVVSCESRVGSQELGAWSAAPQGTFFLPGKCRFFLHGLMTTYESDSIWLTAIVGQLSGCLEDGYVFESEVGVVSESDFKMLSARSMFCGKGRLQRRSRIAGAKALILLRRLWHDQGRALIKEPMGSIFRS